MSTAPHWTGLLIYVAIVLYAGWRGHKRHRAATHTTEGYWSAGKSLTGWATGLSISASFMSISWSCVYAVQLVYWYGLSAAWLLPLPWLLVMIFYYLLVPKFRGIAAFSQPEMLGQRFGKHARQITAVPLAFVFLVWGGAEIYAAAHILSPLLDVDFFYILLGIALVVATYSYLGGFAAVVTTDRVQYALIAFFMTTISIISLVAILSEGTLTDAVATIGKAPRTDASPLLLMALSPALIILTLVAYLPGWVVETDIWLRLQAARSNRAARGGVAIAGVNAFVFIGLAPMIIGLSALYLYPAGDGVIPAELNDGAAIFSILIADHAPVLLGTVLITGLAAAAMSTIDTCSNVVALSLSYDILEPYLQARRSRVDVATVARLMSAAAVFMAFIYALFTESLWDIFYLSSGVLTTTLFIPMVALFRAKASAKRVARAATIGFVSTFLFYFLENDGTLQSFEPNAVAETGLGYILWGLLASFAGYCLPATDTRPASG